jgi:hypothetical protein
MRTTRSLLMSTDLLKQAGNITVLWVTGGVCSELENSWRKGKM